MRVLHLYHITRHHPALWALCTAVTPPTLPGPCGKHAPKKTRKTLKQSKVPYSPLPFLRFPTSPGTGASPSPFLRTNGYTEDPPVDPPTKKDDRIESRGGVVDRHQASQPDQTFSGVVVCCVLSPQKKTVTIPAPCTYPQNKKSVYIHSSSTADPSRHRHDTPSVVVVPLKKLIGCPHTACTPRAGTNPPHCW